MKIISRRARPHTVTLYNYLSAAAGVATYQRTVLRWVYLDTGYQQRLSQRGVATEDAAQLILDLRDLEATDGRTFISPWDWGRLTDEQKAQYFTFMTKQDFFCCGEVPEILPPATKQTMMGKYQCLSVTSVSVPIVPMDGTVEVTAK